MAQYLLDSDAIIDFLAGVPATTALLQGLHGQGDRLCTCTVVLAEVYSGLGPEYESRAESFLRGLRFLPGDPRAGRQAGRWRQRYAREGIALSTTDALIAATAFVHGAAVVTGNIRDFPMDEVFVVAVPRPGSRG